MNTLALNEERFKIYKENRDEMLCLVLEGEIDLENPAPVLRPFLEDVHHTVIREGRKQMILDFNRVSFMNSSGIKEFVQWILKLNKLSEEEKYKIIIWYSTDITWQSTSLPVFEKLQPGYVQLEPGT